MSMPGYIPTDEDIAAMVRDLKNNDPDNANPKYAREMLIRMKLMFRDLGRIDEELLRKGLEEYSKSSKDDQ